MLGMSRWIGADSWDFTLPYFTQARWQPALSNSHVTIWTCHQAWANISCFSAHGFWIGLLLSGRLKTWAKQIHNCLHSPSKAPPQKNHSHAVSKWAMTHYSEISFEDKKFKTKYISTQNPVMPKKTFHLTEVPHPLYFLKCVLSKSTTCIYLVFWNDSHWWENVSWRNSE